MKLEGDYTFNGPRQDVWDMIRDVNILASCLPGTQNLTKINDNEYDGSLGIRIGPVNGSFAGKLTISNEVPPQSYTLTVEGKGAAGFGKGVGNIELVEIDSSKTLFKYSGDLNIGGKLAGVGQRLLDSVGKSMIRNGLDTLDKTLTARIAARSS